MAVGDKIQIATSAMVDTRLQSKADLNGNVNEVFKASTPIANEDVTTKAYVDSIETKPSVLRKVVDVPYTVVEADRGYRIIISKDITLDGSLVEDGFFCYIMNNGSGAKQINKINFAHGEFYGIESPSVSFHEILEHQIIKFSVSVDEFGGKRSALDFQLVSADARKDLADTYAKLEGVPNKFAVANISDSMTEDVGMAVNKKYTLDNLAWKFGWNTNVFHCADATADTHAVNRRAGDTRYAGLLGSSLNAFHSADATADTHAINRRTGDTRYAGLHGSGSNAFYCANPTHTLHALNSITGDTRYAGKNDVYSKDDCNSLFHPKLGNRSLTFEVKEHGDTDMALNVGSMRRYIMNNQLVEMYICKDFVHETTVKRTITDSYVFNGKIYVGMDGKLYTYDPTTTDVTELPNSTVSSGAIKVILDYNGELVYMTTTGLLYRYNLDSNTGYLFSDLRPLVNAIAGTGNWYYSCADINNGEFVFGVNTKGIFTVPLIVTPTVAVRLLGWGYTWYGISFSKYGIFVAHSGASNSYHVLYFEGSDFSKFSWQWSDYLLGNDGYGFGAILKFIKSTDTRTQLFLSNGIVVAFDDVPDLNIRVQKYSYRKTDGDIFGANAVSGYYSDGRIRYFNHALGTYSVKFSAVRNESVGMYSTVLCDKLGFELAKTHRVAPKAGNSSQAFSVGTPTLATHATTKAYVDNLNNNVAPKAGDSNQAFSVGTPTLATHATTKAYVDSLSHNEVYYVSAVRNSSTYTTLMDMGDIILLSATKSRMGVQNKIGKTLIIRGTHIRGKDILEHYSFQIPAYQATTFSLSDTFTTSDLIDITLSEDNTQSWNGGIYIRLRMSATYDSLSANWVVEQHILSRP